MKLIPLGRNGDRGFAKVSDEDFQELSKFKWSPKTRKKLTYAVRGVWLGKKYGQAILYMHQSIMGRNLDHSIVHIDRDPLNNQRSNLRVKDSA
jgi:hypothetical protein